MKTTLCLLMLASLFASGCDSSLVMTPRISTAMIGAGLDLPITDFRTDGQWSTGEAGHGLAVRVWTARDACDYQPDLKLELENAARVCAALARCKPVLEFDYLDLHYLNNYGRIGRNSRLVIGFAEVIIRRETLQMLRDGNVSASEYPRYWKFVQGFKDQPDSETLSW